MRWGGSPVKVQGKKEPGRERRQPVGMSTGALRSRDGEKHVLSALRDW